MLPFTEIYLYEHHILRNLKNYKKNIQFLKNYAAPSKVFYFGLNIAAADAISVFDKFIIFVANKFIVL